MPDWPGPVSSIRERLPAEMRILRGLGGFLAGILITFEVFVVLLGGNWRLGYTHEWLLTTIFGLFVPSVFGSGPPAPASS